MDKQVKLAVAGSGKTYNICHELDKDKRNLIIAYTNQNISNIKKELVSAFGEIPPRTKVMTFDSFIYQHYIRPYEPTILDFFNVKNFCNEGITFKKPPEASIKVGEFRRSNPAYTKNDKFGHYINRKRYYCSYTSKLILRVKKRGVNLLNKASENLSLFFDSIYVDEFQDFRGDDYKFLVGLAKNFPSVTFVGDYYQHSVSGVNNTGIPFKNKKIDVSYNEYIAGLESEGFNVDVGTLKATRRCPKSICAFITKKLGIEIDPDNDHLGEISFVSVDCSKNILDNDKIVKLVYSGSDNYLFNSINWGYSKGDTYEDVCVILTDDFEKIDEDTFEFTESTVTKNKLYVALSRTKGYLYILKKSVFDAIKHDYYSSG